MCPSSKIFVAGHRGLVGSAICRELARAGYDRILVASRDRCDLRNQAQVEKFFSMARPDYVFLCAAKVGGIVANRDNPVDFLLENLQIQNNVISSAAECGVKKLLFLGSACAYPKFAVNPIREGYLLTGAMEPTNEGYALAKIAGIRLCQAYKKQHGRDFIAAMPTNLYGPGDHYDLENSHVMPGMIRRIFEAKDKVVLWGSGNPTREFLFADDLARACIHLMEGYSGVELVNIGGGAVVALRDLAEKLAKEIGFSGTIEWDRTKPDGTPHRYLDNSRITAMGWKPKVSLDEGIHATVNDFILRQKCNAL